MIKLNNGWEIEADNINGYILRKNSGKTTFLKDKEVPIYSITKYPPTLKECIKILQKIEFLEYISENELTLNQAFKYLDELNKKSEAILNELIKTDC